jgi:hypothetical protein
VLDQCRTTPALVESIDGDTAAVLARTLLWDGRSLDLGAWAARDVRWREGGLSLVGAPVPGSWVALHWDVVCDELSPAAAATLERATRRALAAANASASTAAALA